MKVFISYSHKDKEFKEQLVKHLSSLIRQKYICLWYDNMIQPGEDLDEGIMSLPTARKAITRFSNRDEAYEAIAKGIRRVADIHRFQRDFLKKVYQDNLRVRYLHFGDIDAGEFYIHEHLCRVTEIPFGLERMSVEELGDERFLGCLQKLTENDRKRLGGEEYRETVEYMLEENVKPEQEIVSLVGNMG